MIRSTSWSTPEISYQAVESVIHDAISEGRGGFDCEYTPEGPTVIGVASRNRCAAWNWDARLGMLAATAPIVWAAHAGLGADRPVLEKALNIKTNRYQWSDTMVKHWCLNPDLASVPKAATGEDLDDPGTVLGFNNLWTSTSLELDWPNWKSCSGEAECLRLNKPCPRHNQMAYCAVDALAGLLLDYALIEHMKALQIPESYFDWRSRLTEYTVKMQNKGMRVCPDTIKRLEDAIKSRGLELFPWRMVAKPDKVLKNGKVKKYKSVKTWDGPFNPGSPKKVLEWFAAQGIQLKDRKGKASKAKPVILSALERRLRPYGLAFDPQGNGLIERGEKHELLHEEGGKVGDSQLPEALDLLLRLVQKSYAGKGLDSWFGPKYVAGGRVHGRINTCGTCTSRFAMTKPNLMNVARSGWASQARTVFLAEPGCKVLKADYSQLEFRIFLWFAGLDPGLADGAFEMLVERSEGQFEATAERLNWKPRDVAKSLVHANSYGEGLSLRKPEQLTLTKRERSEGALWIYDGQDLPEWQFRGRYVCFTGSNLADRLFGDHAYTSRAKALALQKIVVDAFPSIRALQMKIAAEVENQSPLTGEREVRLPSGHRVPLYGRTVEDDFKFALALYGQGCGAIYAQEGLLNFDDLGIVANLHVHDENVFTDVPKELSEEACLAYVRPMVLPSKYLVREGQVPFTCPIKVGVGPSWGECKTIGEVRL